MMIKQTRMMKERIRINKYLALCGLGSRRKVEEYVKSGRIKINGMICRALFTTIDCNTDTVELDNRRLVPAEEFFYLILNKPRGYITSAADHRGRPTVMDLLPERYRKARVFPVGRLDMDTEGLLLFTNDGDTAYRITHPKFGIDKEYIVVLDRPLSEEHKAEIEKGIYLDGVLTNPSKITFPVKQKSTVKIIINEGKKRQIRLTFMKYKYKVKKLKRLAVGPLVLGKLKSGACRVLKDREIRDLMQQLSAVKNDNFS